MAVIMVAVEIRIQCIDAGLETVKDCIMTKSKVRPDCLGLVFFLVNVLLVF